MVDSRLDDGSAVVPCSYIRTVTTVAANAFNDECLPRCEMYEYRCQCLPFATHKMNFNKWNEILPIIIYGFRTRKKMCSVCKKGYVADDNFVVYFRRHRISVGLRSVAWMNGELRAKRMYIYEWRHGWRISMQNFIENNQKRPNGLSLITWFHSNYRHVSYRVFCHRPTASGRTPSMASKKHRLHRRWMTESHAQQTKI